MTRRYKALRGTKDILPEESPRWQWLEETTRRLFGRYGFREVRTPIIESSELFARSVGASSDIVRKEMYTFSVGDESICLRPESTASVVRAVVEHALHRQVAAGYPERYFYIGPMFRHERPQKGRQRQFHQIGVEVLGASEPLADGETIQMADALLEALGIEERELVVNSVGDSACRPAYREKLKEWLEPRLARLCDDCRRRQRDNPLRVFDCKVEEDQRLLSQAPRIGECLCSGCEDHFSEVRRMLDGYGLAYRIEPNIVRGLDYYVRTVFEILSPSLGAQNAILGGGRYDGLVEELGGPSLAGFGFAVGMERLLMLAEGPATRGDVDLALICLGDAGWQASLLMAHRLRAAGIGCIMPLLERPMGAQLRRADRLGARFAVFVGEEELSTGKYRLRDLSSGEQTRLDEAGLTARLKEKRT